jgi:hypothetical protein
MGLTHEYLTGKILFKISMYKNQINNTYIGACAIERAVERGVRLAGAKHVMHGDSVPKRLMMGLMVQNP